MRERASKKKLFLPALMSVTTPERPETPQSAALTAEKHENGRTRGAGDGDKEREREPLETPGKRERMKGVRKRERDERDQQKTEDK